MPRLLVKKKEEILAEYFVKKSKRLLAQSASNFISRPYPVVKIKFVTVL